LILHDTLLMPQQLLARPVRAVSNSPRDQAPTGLETTRTACMSSVTSDRRVKVEVGSVRAGEYPLLDVSAFLLLFWRDRIGEFVWDLSSSIDGCQEVDCRH